ncbi:MAG: hypothetical protein Q7J84_04140, partial [Sulfuricaulis sp.]|nr:hypothetical protein [Sulfuricaulis sp.]
MLTVNGTGPAGSPNPNSGTGVGLAPMTLVASPVPQSSPSAVATAVPFAFTGAQVWQAAPGTQPGNFFLRSGESFTVDRTNNAVGSLLLGYGATEAVLELGYLPNWYTAIFLDQSNSPTGDNSCFEQWSYDTSTAQITNCNGGQLSEGSPTVNVGGGTSAPGNQWYALPNYHLVDIVTRANASPLFPAWTANQQNAYNWISAQPTINATGPCVPVAVGVGANQMTGQCFTGVRNEYQNSNFQTAQTNSNIQSLAYPSATPSPFFGPADLQAVQNQLNLELTYVGDVQGLIGNARTVLATVFWENSNVLTKVVADLGVSSTAKPFAVAAQIVEGSLYTLLCALGPVTGVVANVIQTAFDTTAISQPSFEQEVGGTVGELAGNLNTQFNFMSNALTLDYNSIVYDWSRLSEVGPATQQAGYWGLFWPDTLTGIIVPYMVNGYEITVMKALLPLTYNLHEVVGQTSASIIPFSPPSYAQYGWDFGSAATTMPVGSMGTTDWAGYYNQGYWETGSTIFHYPSATVMQNDLLDLGANPFEVFSGINGWGGGVGTVYYPNLSCEGVAVTLFNATPSDLWVNYTTVQGEESGISASSHKDFGAIFDSEYWAIDGLKGTAWAELRPFGYTTMFYAQDNVTPTNQTGSITVFDPNFSTSSSVAFFEEGQDGCTADSHTNIHKGATTAGNYSWSGGLHTRGQSSGEPGGVWGTLINS